MNRTKLPKTVNLKKAESKALVPRDSYGLADNKGQWYHHQKDREDGEIFASFSKKISQVQRLSEEEEKALGYKIKNYDDELAKQKLVLHNMRLAVKMAYQYKRDWTNMMDLVQEASFGMAIAAKKWDPDQNVRFGTYAAYWIKAQLTKFLMNNARLINTSKTKAGRKIYFQLPGVQRKLLLEGKTPTPELIAQEVGEDPKEVALVLNRISGGETSMSSTLGGDDFTVEDTIAGSIEDPEKKVSAEEMQILIKKLIYSFEQTLTSKRDKAIWKENLISDSPISLVELGKRYDVSKQRIAQIATRIKRRFRCHIIDYLGPNTNLSWLFNTD